LANAGSKREIPMGESDVTVEILEAIRDELRVLRADTNTQFGGVREGIHLLRADTNERFGVVESSLLELTDRRHRLARFARLMSGRDGAVERDGGIEARVIALESRVDKLESK
jgi:hypothetical protein